MKSEISTLVLAAAAAAALFSPGAVRAAPSLVVYRVGNGTETLSVNGNSVFLDDYGLAGGTPISSVNVSATGQPFSAAGSTASEGQITASPDGTTVAFTGYRRAPGGTTSVVATASSAVPRVAGLYNVASGTVDQTTALADAYTASNINGAYTDGRGGIYTSGNASGANAASGGVRYTTVGKATSVGVTAGGTTTNSPLGSGTGTTSPNARAVNVFGGQLYFSGGVGYNIGVNAVGTGTPTAAAQPTTNVNFLDDMDGADPYAFLFLDLSPDVPGNDTCYVADGSNGIQKYFSDDGTNYFLTSSSDFNQFGIIPASGLHGLTGTVDPKSGAVDLYASSSRALYSYVDTSGFGDFALPNGTLNTIATAPVNEAFRGVALVSTTAAAVPEPTTVAVVAAGGVGLLGRRRRRRV